MSIRNKLAILLSCLAIASARADGPNNPGGGGGFPHGNEVQILGDSIWGLGTGFGSTYVPANPITITGDLSTSTCLANVSSLVGIQVGAGIGSATNMPANDYVTAIGACSGANSLTMNGASTGTAVGQTMYVAGNIPSILGSTYLMGHGQNSAFGWLQAFSGGAFNLYQTSGYQGNFTGIVAIKVLNGGTGFSSVSPPVFTIGAGSIKTAGTITCVVNAAGAITSCPAPSPAGAGYSPNPSFTQTSGTVGSGQSLSAVMSGSGSFAINGQTTTEILARVPDVCAARPNIVILHGGTNDIFNGVSAATIMSNLSAAVTQLNGCNISVALAKLMPRGTWSGASSSAAISTQKLERVNRSIEVLGTQAYTLHTGKPSLVIIDPNRYVVDAANSSSPGFPITGYNTGSDTGVHPAMPAAFFAGLAAKAALAPWISPNTTALFGQSQSYDATNLPGGNLLLTKGLFLSTGGTNSTTCTTTALAAGWTFSKISGTATIACALSIENPRTDATSGQRQVITFTSLATGGAVELFDLRMSTSATNLSAGDQIYMSCELELSSYVQVNMIGIQLVENNQTGSLVQQANHLANVSAQQVNGFLPTSTVMAGLPLQGLLPGFGIANGGFKLYLSTRNSPITVQPSNGGYSPNIYLGFDATSGTATGTLKVSNCGVWKVAA